MRGLAAAFALLLAALSAASAAPIRIVAFGDSATSGWLVPRADAYPAQLQRLLRKKGYNVTVKNAGLAGDTTAGALRRFDLAIDPGTDVAIVEFGTNDLRRGVSAKRMRSNLTEIVRSLRARHIQVMLVGLGRLDLSDVAHAQGVAYAQWRLPPGRYRARDGAHFNAEGYAKVIVQMLPQLEPMLRNASPR